MAIEKTPRPESNPDPITGAPGAHPVGVGLGAAGVQRSPCEKQSGDGQ